MGKVKGYNLNIHDCMLYLATPPIPLPAKTIKKSFKELLMGLRLKIWIEGIFEIDKPGIVLQNNFYFTTNFIIRVLIIDDVC